MLRIISGEFRSRLLATPADAKTTRPMTDRAKESIFNLLRGWFDDATVLDLFAGVGSLGLEAVSRGAAMVVMVERDRHIVDLLRRNVTTLDVADRTKVLQADALAPEVVASVPRPVQVVFMDPPYAMMEEEASRRRIFEQAARCGALMEEGGFLVLRTPLDPDRTPHEIDGFDGPEVHRYGAEMFTLLYAPTNSPREATEQSQR